MCACMYVFMHVSVCVFSYDENLLCTFLPIIVPIMYLFSYSQFSVGGGEVGAGEGEGEGDYRKKWLYKTRSIRNPL